jgi:hypothetical protein
MNSWSRMIPWIDKIAIITITPIEKISLETISTWGSVKKIRKFIKAFRMHKIMLAYYLAKALELHM